MTQVDDTSHQNEEWARRVGGWAHKSRAELGLTSCSRLLALRFESSIWNATWVRVKGSGSQGLGFKVWGLGFKVAGRRLEGFGFQGGKGDDCEEPQLVQDLDVRAEILWGEEFTW